MKGQIFIAVSVFVAIALLLLAAGSSINPAPEDYLQDYFVNIRTELTETASYAILDGADAGTAIDEYASFSNSILRSKDYTQTVQHSEDAQYITIDIYLGSGEEYYQDTIIIDKSVYT